jgi:hypothetical protein
MLLLVPMQCTGTGQVAIRRMEGLQKGHNLTGVITPSGHL